MAAGDVITIVEDNVAKKGVYFDGTDDYILVDAHAVERVAANDTTGTYSAWIFSNSINTTMDFISAGDNDSATEYLALGLTDGRFRVKLYHGGATQWELTVPASAALQLKTWNHVAVVQDGVLPVLYINGVAVSSAGTTTDTTYWYDELTGCDKFAIGCRESNATHTFDWNGAIGQVRYWSRALSAAEIAKIYNGESVSTGDYPDSTYLRLNISMEDNGTTDSGAGADNGTLTGNAHYGGYISKHSMALEANTTGHAAERSTTWQVSPNKLCSVIVRGD